MTGPIYLVPELCFMTGLSDEQRANFQLMKALGDHTRQDPKRRTQTLMKFNERITAHPEIQKDLAAWNLEFSKKMDTFGARIITPEEILGKGTSKATYKVDNADWGTCFRKWNSFSAPDLTKWAVIHSQKDDAVTKEFVNSMTKVTPSLGMKWSKPRMICVPDHKPSSYETALDQVLAQNPQIVMAVIPANKGDHYSIIKKKCSVERPISPIPSQVVTAATLISQARGLMSVATTVAVQMNNKLGGGGETLPPELILTNITEHGPRPAAARVTWDRGNTGDTYDWKRQRKRHRGEEEDEDVVVSETSDEED